MHRKVYIYEIFLHMSSLLVLNNQLTIIKMDTNKSLCAGGPFFNKIEGFRRDRETSDHITTRKRHQKGFATKQSTVAVFF